MKKLITLLVLITISLTTYAQQFVLSNCDDNARQQTFFVTPTPNSTYEWVFNSEVLPSTTSMVTIVLPSTEGVYTLTVTEINEYGCRGFAQLTQIQLDPCSIYIPNAFTPNIDAFNSEFKVYSYEPIGDFTLLIFNRWGECLFSTHNQANGWDGTYKGQPCQDGVYVYKVTGTVNGKVYQNIGRVTLFE